MSYFDDASLVMIPSGYKTSKVYSVKPTDGTGDLTFTRSNDTATRVASNGLIEKVRTNTFLYSEDFSDATWVKERISVSSNVTTAPDGTSTADKIVENTDNNSHRARQNANSTQGVEYTLSCYLKASERTKARIVAGGLNASADFDLSTGVIIGSPTLCTASITSVGSGWYRCAITYTQTSVTSAVQLHLIATLNAAGDFVYTGDGTSGIFVWGAMLETGVLTDYIATTSAAVSVGPVANVPRLDYLNSSCPRLLLEPQRTNLSTYSEQLNNAVWFKETGNSVTANTIASPDGYTNADTTTATSTNAINVNQSHTSASSSVHTFSIFLKKNNLSEIQVYIFSAGFLARANVNLDNGTITNLDGSGATITSYGNGWYRCSVQATINTGVGFTIGYLSASTTGSRSIYTYGSQLEAGAYATSYIPTLEAAVTRGADAASKTGISSLIGQTEGTLFVEFEKSQNFYNYYSISDGTNTNWIFIGQDADNPDRLRAYVKAGTVTTDINVGPVANGTYKIAIGYKTNDVVFYVNGTLSGTDTSTTIPSGLSDFALTNLPSTSASLTNKVSQALLFKTRLTNAQLAELTTI